MYKSKPTIKNAIQWTGFNIQEFARVIGKENILAHYDTCEVVIKTDRENMVIPVNHWVIILDDGFNKMSDVNFKKNFEEVEQGEFSLLDVVVK